VILRRIQISPMKDRTSVCTWISLGDESQAHVYTCTYVEMCGRNMEADQARSAHELDTCSAHVIALAV